MNPEQDFNFKEVQPQLPGVPATEDKFKVMVQRFDVDSGVWETTYVKPFKMPVGKEPNYDRISAACRVAKVMGPRKAKA